MQYAVIKTGGKQYRVSPGDVIEVERLSETAGGAINFEEVLLLTTDGQSNFGFPRVENAVVVGKILDHLKGEKIRVSTFKSKVRYRRVHGHRQYLSKVMIESFMLGNKKISTELKPMHAAVAQEPVQTATVESTAQTGKPKAVKKS